jgi:tetratricopeptide (TPR) repeat protein
MPKRRKKNTKVEAVPASAVHSTSLECSNGRRLAGWWVGKRGKVVIALALFFAVIGVYLPCLRNDFVDFDDPIYVYANPHVQQGFSAESIRWAFTSCEGGLWHPLTWLSIMLDCGVYGMGPAGHHLTSIVLHGINTVLVFMVLSFITGAVWPSAFVAALFGLHPLHVESVAWATERKDVLSTLFLLLSLLAYAKHAALQKEKQPRDSMREERGAAILRLRLALSFICFVLALMSKAMVVTLPVLLLLLDWWPLGRVRLSDWKGFGPLVREKWPFFAASLAVGVVTIAAQKSIDALPTTSQFPLGARLANAVLCGFVYLRQMFWPVDLAAYYPYPTSFSPALVGVAVVLWIFIFALAVRLRKQRPYFAFGWVWYVVTLLPVIGLLQAGGQPHADRYTYVPLLGVLVGITWWISEASRAWSMRGAVLSVTAAAVIGACGCMTAKQIGYWKNSVILFSRAVAVTKDNETAYCNLGSGLAREGRLPEAIAAFQEALRLVPTYREAESNLGAALAKAGRLDEAMPYLKEAVAEGPRNAIAHCNLADALTLQGRLDEAISEYEAALKLTPDDVAARCNYGHALAGKGRLEEAIKEYRETLRLYPASVDAHKRLGVVLAMTGHLDEGLGHLHQAVELKPQDPEAHCNLGIALIQKDKPHEAIEELRKALALRTEYPEAHCNLGVALGKEGHFKEAIPALQEALRLRPDYVDAANNLRIAQGVEGGVKRDE